MIITLIIATKHVDIKITLLEKTGVKKIIQIKHKANIIDKTLINLIF